MNVRFSACMFSKYNLFRLPNSRMSRETLRVPTSTVPALIGLKGEKIKDIRISSGATIWFDSGAGPLTTAHVQGSAEQTRMAISLLKLSVLHARAADHRAPPVLSPPSKASQAFYDLHMFGPELLMASSCQTQEDPI